MSAEWIATSRSQLDTEIQAS